MRSALAILALAGISMGAPASSADTSSSNTNATFLKLQQTYQKNTLALLSNGTYGTACTKQNVVIRRSWSNLTTTERTDYLNAVKCMHNKPSITDPKVCPGARNRLDDFTYAHINQTNFMHVDGVFLPWHRQFVWAYEKALREECGYKGYQPYWDWSEYSDDQSKSPVWDGSATSFGGNGKAVPHSGDNFTIPGLPQPFVVTRPAGSGGGCVTNGALVNATTNNTFIVNLGPAAPANNTPDNLYGTHYNPRCLKRDWLNSLSSNNLSWSFTNQLMLQSDIHGFRPFLDQYIHPAAHSFVGADLFDLFTSPSDPAFYMLHGNIDRLWTVWQGQDYASRALALDGTLTFNNIPPSANATLNSTMIMGTTGGNLPVSRGMSAIGQGTQFCYMYQ